MHWWQGAFTSSSRKDSDDHKAIVSAGSHSVNFRFFSSRISRHLSRSRKSRNVESWRSRSLSEHYSPAKSPAAERPDPQPLPLPEDPKSASPTVPLPFRVSSQNQRGAYEDGERHNTPDDVDGLRRINRLVGQNAHTNIEQSQMRSCSCRKKSPPKQIPKARSSFGYRISVPASAPSSPCLSPLGSDMMAAHYMTPPSIFHVWSAPEIPYSSDWSSGHNLYRQISLERKGLSADNSPIQSPFLTRRESNVQATVHPLPRPPWVKTHSQPGSISRASSIKNFSGASSPSHPASISSHGSEPDKMKMKSQWRKGKLIGRGTFGSVYVATNRETGALCAMKEVEILPDDSGSVERMRQMEQEISVLSHLKHPNIVQYFGSEIVRDKFHIYLEYVHPGSINKFIQDHCGSITESIVRNFTRHILCGLAYLHSTKTIHRDIKCANLLVDAYGVVKLADFGMAKHMNGDHTNLSLKGSPYWLAPELLDSVRSKDASSDTALAVDIWSLGCTIIEMMDGKPPWSEYEGAAALFKVLKETPPIPDTLSSEGKDFLKCCFRRNPANRPTASQLLDHPFVNYTQQQTALDASTHKLKGMPITDFVQRERTRPRHRIHQASV